MPEVGQPGELPELSSQEPGAISGGQPAGMAQAMSDPLLAADGFLCWHVLRKAALRTSLRLASAASSGKAAEDLAKHVIPLAEIIWQRAILEQNNAAIGTPPLPAGLLLETLRREVIEELSLVGERVGTARVLQLLRSFDEVTEQLESDPTQRFAGRFAGAGGMEAVVEVAHDMRSPLASIVLLVETMRQGQSGPITEVQDRQLSLVYGAAFGLSLLSNDLIELARGDDRLIEKSALPFSVRNVMQSVVEIVQPIAEEKKLELRLAPPSADWRKGYPTALQRVLLNLTTNALKFTDSGFVELSAIQHSRTTVEFVVTDSGSGIPEHSRDTLFDAFRQNHLGGSPTFSSSGLGLAICRKLVTAMGGELRGENNTGDTKGARFSFTLELPQSSRI